MRLVLALFILFNSSCHKPCNLDLRIGEMVSIPIEFKGFTVSQIKNTLVYRIPKQNTEAVDTILLRDMMYPPDYITESSVFITDVNFSGKNEDYYYSSLNDCHLILDWFVNKDTIADIVIKKSKEDVKDRCYKDHPNVKIDELKFVHKGKVVSKGQKIIINF
ncbi:MAG: hypothetical protein ACK4K9_04775 [Bacteroidia bacterium]